jgi:hypothetical protein
MIEARSPSKGFQTDTIDLEMSLACAAGFDPGFIV